MSAGAPVFKAYAVDALHVGAVFADVAVVYPDAVGQERIARTSAGAFKASRMAFSVILECFTSTDSAIFVEIITLI